MEDEVAARGAHGVADEITPQPSSTQHECSQIVVSEVVEPPWLPQLRELDAGRDREPASGCTYRIEAERNRQTEYHCGGPQCVAGMLLDEGGDRTDST